MDNKNNYFYKFGYKNFGPLLLAFSQWLLEELKHKHIKKVYFLARDGFIMKNAFDSINTTSIKSYYFYASRRSIIIPSLWKLDNKMDIFNTIIFKKEISIKAFLKKVGLEDTKIKNELNLFNYRMGDKIDIVRVKELKDQRFLDFLDKIFPYIKSNAEEEYKGFCRYIEKMEIEEEIAIVDIGWYGTMQKALKKLLPNNRIYGYYMGLVPQDGYYDEKAKGFLFDKTKNKCLYEQFHYFINIFEFLFLGQHGSVKKFVNEENIVEFYEYEYSNKIEKEFSEQIQRGAIDFIKTNNKKNIYMTKYIKIFLKPMLNPKLRDAIYFGNINFSDDETKFIAKPSKNIFSYIFNVSKLKKDFIESSWRIGFLKRIFIIPLPYYRINEIIRKIFI